MGASGVDLKGPAMVSPVQLSYSAPLVANSHGAPERLLQTSACFCMKGLSTPGAVDSVCGSGDRQRLMESHVLAHIVAQMKVYGLASLVELVVRLV